MAKEAAVPLTRVFSHEAKPNLAQVGRYCASNAQNVKRFYIIGIGKKPESLFPL